ncbi:DMT family transporter [Brevibacillus laterosporus]|uniref:EamA/RhaT family transporter n=1 Tax=Brevibacillus laterosporus TaxID=1465 RepID=A0AAP8QCE4_BRELA|nr:DMT family transporter [Brevibacillus laterosporus]MED1664179.1 DMT family transporter [Brevibacillus laterosporus]MED1669797.1 DMT family transporter [Brevibacillus laterosporus]MED1717915.1 DMT family transporter [Brevibacillus laterosporus]PPA88672.1 EamA/RhaT family transporter [Brevibacillus laterosporus]PPB02087.1 EamA/RhaT family transporter [Brevibacillus laterosporus]
MSNSTIAYVKVSIAMSIVGSFVVVNKFILEQIPIFLASELRLLIASLILLPMFYRKERRFPTLYKKDAFVLLVQSFVGIFLFSVCLLYGLQYTSAVESGIVLSCTPAAMGVIAYVFLKEKLGVAKISGILLTILGTISINVFGIISTNSISFSSLFGNFLILCAVIGDAIFFSFGKLLSKAWSPLAISTALSIIGAILFLPLAIHDSLSIDFSQISISVWLLVFYTAIIVTILAVILMNQGLKVIPASVASVFTALTPITTILLSSLVLKEDIYWYHILGMGFVVLGIIVLTRTNEKSVGMNVVKTDEAKL